MAKATATKVAAKRSAKSDKGKRSASDKPVGRGEAIGASWQDPKVHAARTTRHKVKVNGTEYNSVGAAFRELGLPGGKQIKFRMELKATASGRKAFQTEGGDKVTFTLVK